MCQLSWDGGEGGGGAVSGGVEEAVERLGVGEGRAVTGLEE